MSTGLGRVLRPRLGGTRAICALERGWNIIVGLEVHAQLDTCHKLFSPAAVNPDAPANTLVAPFDRALPGSLPLFNWECAKLAVKAALGLACTINHVSFFDRKHYQYVDLPAGYQITQYRRPLALNGVIPTIEGHIRVKQIHLEQDTARVYYHPDTGLLEGLDLNRCGVGLIEIVTEPDIRSAVQAVAVVKWLRDMLINLKVCRGILAKGNMRFDVNISVTGPRAPSNSPPLGERVEIKNINTFNGLEHAIEVEGQRQIAILEGGGRIERETRSWNESVQQTRISRDKETRNDYRFLPEFDVPPLVLSEEFIEKIKAEMPPTRNQKLEQLMAKDLSLTTASILLDRPVFLKTYQETGQQVIVADFLCNHYAGLIERYGKEVDQADLIVLMKELAAGKISSIFSSL